MRAELDIFEAAATGSTGRVKDLLESNPHQLNAYNVDGFHPLGLASFFGHYDTAKLLLSKELALIIPPITKPGSLRSIQRLPGVMPVL